MVIAAETKQVALSDRPLTPIIFSAYDNTTTVFACAVSKQFYLYHRFFSAGEDQISAFPGIFPSVEAFFDGADWNQLQDVTGNKDTGEILCAATGYCWDHKFPPIRIDHLRVAANQSHPRHTLRDMCPPQGSFMYTQRIFDCAECKYLSDWPRIPDTQLPEPWSCEWWYYHHCDDWYDGGLGPQATLESMYGVVGLMPSMFVPFGPHRGDTVLCAAGTYYLWWNAHRDGDVP
ncbi:hypothetical protein B0H16DRAFT_1727765 [Mycena metata]|uniref:Uncharacterized protein n=1 Tax=Mycena metata TaxID=1033252 RepID=A0AAD7IHS2_9AGAR|nr:hypothetical protein B0H16DRAFT_1727765 [Mycena metata]